MQWGGARKGAGRPRQGEQTKTVRIPVSLENQLKQFLNTKGHVIPLYSSRVSAGMPLHADDHIDSYINVYEKLAPVPNETFSVIANGDSMVDAGINDGDLLIVKTADEANHKQIVVAALDGLLTVKTLYVDRGKLMLVPENKKYQPILITEEVDFRILGIVTHTIRSF